jgi:carbonic anhydrase/acetyltransferase-like protein (isoleucine patch superfamily)
MRPVGWILVAGLLGAKLDAAEPEEVREWRLKDTAPFRAGFVKTAGFDSERSKAFVLLRKENGKLRGYALETLSPEDQAYVRKSIPPPSPPPATRPAYEAHPTAYRETPDEIQVAESDHFRFVWGRTISESARKWADPAFREMNLKYFEKVWDFFERDLAVVMPYAKEPEKHKINVYVTGTGLKNHKEGFAFGGKEIIIHPGAMLEGSSVIPHEFGHTLSLFLGGFRNSKYVGWFWECHANWGSHQMIPSYPPALAVYFDRSSYELCSTRMNYGSWPFLEFLAEDPRFGPAFCYEIWEKNRKNAKEESLEDPFQTMMRLGVEKKIFDGDGVRGFGDIIGGMAARNVTWDYTYQSVYQREEREHFKRLRESSRLRTVLESVPDRPGWFRPPAAFAPRQYGYNLIDLLPDPSGETVEVDLEGVVDEKEGSDWRATIVAIDEGGEARYSPMWSRGKGSMRIRATEKTLTLAVAATPSVYTPLHFRMGANVKRPYPYEVSFKGCVPVSGPQNPVTPKGEGTRHPNGGGFVARGAKVAPTAFVGKGAMVLDGAQVADTARVEDSAAVTDQARVSGNAVVSGFARVSGRAEISGNARVRDHAAVKDQVTVTENAQVFDYARLFGNGKVAGDAVVQGFADARMTGRDAKANKDVPGELSGTAVMGADTEYWPWEKPVTFGLLYDYVSVEQLKQLQDLRGLYAHWDFNEPRKQVLRDTVFYSDGVVRGAAGFGVEEGRRFMTLNGKDVDVLIPRSLSFTRALTIEARVKWEGGGKSPRLLEFVSRAGALFLTPKDEQGRAAFVIRKGDSVQTLRADGPLPAGRWVRWIVTLGGGAATMYVDDQPVGRSDAMTLVPDDIGAEAGYLGREFAGSIDDLSIYRKAYSGPAELPDPAGRPAGK